MPPLDNGTYLVSWQVLSAVDGQHHRHLLVRYRRGLLAGVVGNTQTAAQIDPLSALRWLSLTAIVLLLGLFSFDRFSGRLPDRPVTSGKLASVDQRFTTLASL
ncbi:MAG: hypothetical protein H6651_13450 [Ardenticatenales bacterium]|nr:hypothetical protein [Ardenticatenales bacterium]